MTSRQLLDERSTLGRRIAATSDTGCLIFQQSHSLYISNVRECNVTVSAWYWTRPNPRQRG